MSTTALETINHVIGGAQTAGASTRTSPVYDPATGQVQRNVLLGTPADVDAAVSAARAAFGAWADTSVVLPDGEWADALGPAAAATASGIVPISTIAHHGCSVLVRVGKAR